MADVCVDDEVVTKFLLNTCRLHQRLKLDSLVAFEYSATVATLRGSSYDDEAEYVPTTTGSVAELYIQPMLSCVGDVDIMFHLSDQLAIPAGTAPPTQLPGDFHSRVKVCEIVDSEFPGYVYLMLSYLLTECVDDGKYKALQCQRQYMTHEGHDKGHGPAFISECLLPFPSIAGRLAGADNSVDIVYCMRCFSWPSQAADWPTRHRNYGCPDSATVDRVVSSGSDVVAVAHRRCRQDEWMNMHQWRLSFSRAEIVLLNSWMPVQQIVYHLLRVFAKTKRLTDRAITDTLSNYHIKTLMLWPCELKPRSWWTDANVVRITVTLLHTLGVWLTDARCPHYFIHNCNLFDHPDNCYRETANRLMSVTETSLAEWFIINYIRKCAQMGPVNVSWLFDDTNDIMKLQEAVADVAELSLCRSLATTPSVSEAVQKRITSLISHDSLTVRSCLCWMSDMAKIGQCLSAYTTAVIFLHVAYKATGGSLVDELLDVLATTCLQCNDIRLCVTARHSSVLSLSQAAKLMKVVANKAHSFVQLIEIELSKAYLYRALRCKDSDCNSIYCLAHVYLAVLYYTTGHYQTAIDHCTLVTRSQDHSHCSSHVVQGELLPKIDDDTDNVLGLSVFYQYLRTAALNQQQQTQHVSVFTTELFAHYLHIRCLSVMKCRQLTQTSSTDEVSRYQKCLYKWQEIFISDVLLLNIINYGKHSRDNQAIVTDQTVPETSGEHDTLDTSELVELLQQSAVEHLTAFRQLEAQNFSSMHSVVTTDFEALYAYKCGEYQRCLQLSTYGVRTLMSFDGVSFIPTYPEFIQLMDDRIVSLIGLTLIVDPSFREDHPCCAVVSQLPLSLHLMTQCQMKLHHPVTSLAQTLNFVKVARRKYIDKASKLAHTYMFTCDRLLLKLTEREILLYQQS